MGGFYHRLSPFFKNVIYIFLGARETDYPAGEEVSPNAVMGAAEDGSSQSANSSSAGVDGVLGGITVVSCEAEGASAVPQTAGKDADLGQ